MAAARAGWTVRIAEADDAGALVDLVHAYVVEANPRLIELTGRTIVAADEAEARRWVSASRAEGAITVLTLDSRSALGTGTLRQLEAGVAEFKRIYVRPQFRGSGMGATLLDELLGLARCRGARVVRLDSAPFQLCAHALYRSYGFVERGPYRGAEVPEDLVNVWHFFELTLDLADR